MTDRLEKLVAANEALKSEIASRISDQERFESIARISEENPNPVLRVSTLGSVLYANEPAGVLLPAWAIRLRQERRQGGRDRRDQPTAQSRVPVRTDTFAPCALPTS